MLSIRFPQAPSRPPGGPADPRAIAEPRHAYAGHGGDGGPSLGNTVKATAAKPDRPLTGSACPPSPTYRLVFRMVVVRLDWLVGAVVVVVLVRRWVGVGGGSGVRRGWSRHGRRCGIRRSSRLRA